MKITDVKVNIKEREGSKMRAYASVTLDDCFVIHDIRVLDGEDGLFIAMPSRKSSTGDKYRDVAHPINKETRALFHDAVINKYNEVLEESESEEE